MASKRAQVSRGEEFGLYREHVRDLLERTSSVLERFGTDRLVLHSGSPVKRTSFDDQYWPLRPTPHFQHWLCLPQPGAALLLASGRRPKLLWPDAPNFWEKPAAPPREDFLGEFDLKRPLSDAAMAAEVKRFLGSRTKAFIGDDARAAHAWGFSAREANPARLLGALDQLRVCKTPYEVHCLRVANQIAARGHREVRRAFAAGDASELDLHLRYLRATGQDDPETPYKNIVAVGENAATLHHVDYRKQAESRRAEALLLDAGACHLGYCSDITRTYVKGSGATASVFGDLLDRMERLQKNLCAEVALGRKYESLHEASQHGVATILSQVGISKLSPEATFRAGISRSFYPHGLGHSLGLQCHDVGCALVKPKPENPFLRNTTVIGEGQCFTIEPGLYFIAPLLQALRGGKHRSAIQWKLVDALRPFGGIRIEDDLSISSKYTGCYENMTRPELPNGSEIL